jgi:hypothetical protein
MSGSDAIAMYQHPQRYSHYRVLTVPSLIWPRTPPLFTSKFCQLTNGSHGCPYHTSERHEGPAHPAPDLRTVIGPPLSPVHLCAHGP